MKKFKVYFFILSFSSALSWGQTKAKFSQLTVIEFTSVDRGEISKKLRRPIKVEDSTTITTEVRKLSPEQIKYFAEVWNTASYQGVCKFKAKYLIHLYFKDGSMRTFRLNNNIKEIREYCYAPKDNTQLKELWKKAKSGH
ncbi:MAG TPA: hypothetical protein PL029_03670 [Bacteroidia bacterium]|nr:hypothetical protein [Bacteroidia bacterium]